MARAALSIALFSIVVVGACRREELRDGGAAVTAGRSDPTPDCKPLGHLTGKGGGAVGGALVSNEALIEYALNDLRNQAAELGANYLQHDPPQLGEHEGTTTSVTITGTAYSCQDGDQPRGNSIAVRSAAEERPEAGAEAGAEDAAKPPPSGAAGFDFESNSEECERTCTSAGHAWNAGEVDHFQCSGTPVDIGPKARTLLRFCAGRLCGIVLTMDSAAIGSKGWTKTFIDLKTALSAKYGAPAESDSVIPGDCRGDALAECLEQGRARSRFSWSWSTREKLELSLGKPGSGEGAVAIRAQYVKQLPEKSSVKAEGL